MRSNKQDVILESSDDESANGEQGLAEVGENVEQIDATAVRTDDKRVAIDKLEKSYYPYQDTIKQRETMTRKSGQRNAEATKRRNGKQVMKHESTFEGSVFVGAVHVSPQENQQGSDKSSVNREFRRLSGMLLRHQESHTKTNEQHEATTKTTVEDLAARKNLDRHRSAAALSRARSILRSEREESSRNRKSWVKDGLGIDDEEQGDQGVLDHVCTNQTEAGHRRGKSQKLSEPFWGMWIDKTKIDRKQSVLLFGTCLLIWNVATHTIIRTQW